MQNRLEQLDLIRGLAVALVIACHAVQYFPTGVPLLDKAVGLGRFGVQLFFIVSAYTMAMMWERRASEDDRAYRFYVRRFMRIAPGFWIAGALYLWINGTGPSYFAPDGIGAVEVFLSASFLHGLWPSAINSVVPGGWSIADEMLFYAMFPVLIAHLRTPLSCMIASLVCFAFTAFVVAPVAPHVIEQLAYLVEQFVALSIVSQLPAFLLGIAVYWWRAGEPADRSIAWSALAFLILAVGAVAAGQSKIAMQTAIVVIEAAFAALVLRSGISSRFLAAIGRQSYVMYLAHFACFAGLQRILPGGHILSTIAALIVATAASYLLSVAFERTIEVRARRLVAHLTTPRRPAIA